MQELREVHRIVTLRVPQPGSGHRIPLIGSLNTETKHEILALSQFTVVFGVRLLLIRLHHFSFLELSQKWCNLSKETVNHP